MAMIDAAEHSAATGEGEYDFSELHVTDHPGLAGQALREMAQRAISISIAGLENGAACAGDPSGPVRHLERLASRHGLPI